jgi:hypothetical protein
VIDFLYAEDYGADSETNLNTSNYDNSISESVINREILSVTTCLTLCQGKIVYVLVIVMMHS